MTPSQLRAMLDRGPPAPTPTSPSGATPLERLNTIRAAQANRVPRPGSPGFTGPPLPPGGATPPAPPAPPAQPGMLSRAAGAARTTAGVVGRGLGAVTSAPFTGAAMMLTPSVAQAGTLDSPEAQRQIAINEATRRERGDAILASEPTGSFVNELLPTTPAEAVNRQPGGPAPLPGSPGVTRFASPTGEGMERRSYTSPQGGLTGVVPTERLTQEGMIPRGRGGFVGASTDAEAMRNQQSRMLQDTMASANAASMNRAADMMKENRMIRRGMERGIAGGPARMPGIWDRPGDGRGDAQFRENRYNSLINDAARQKGFGASKRADRMLKAAELGRAPGETTLAANVAGAKASTGGPNPLDAQRFLLDQQKLNQQQGMDSARLGIKQGTLEDRRSKTALEQKKYSDERRAAFMDSFSYPDKNAPREQLGALTFSLSEATGGQISPELMQGYLQRAAEEAGINWKKGGPKSMTKLGERAIELATLDYQGQ
jgi:hypothetical protein